MLDKSTWLDLLTRLLFTLLVFLIKKLGLLDKFLDMLNLARAEKPVDKSAK